MDKLSMFVLCKALQRDKQFCDLHQPQHRSHQGDDRLPAWPARGTPHPGIEPGIHLFFMFLALAFTSKALIR